MPSDKTPTPEQPSDASGQAPPPGWLYTRVRRGRPSRMSAAWGLWLGISLAVHVVVLLAFAAIRLRTVIVERRTIQFDTDFVEIYRTEPVTHRSVIKLDESVSVSERAAQLRDALAAKAKAVPIMEVDDLDLASMKLDLLARKDTDRAPRWHWSSDLTREADRDRQRDYKGVMDEAATDILRQIKKRQLLVVILLDQSQSLKNPRTLLKAQLQRGVGDLKFAMTDAEEKRLRWSVVMFGRDVGLWLKPTPDTQEVIKALDEVPFDNSGEENVVKAVNYCLKELGGQAERMFILLLTDEQGDDVGVSEGATASERRALELVVGRCKRKKTSVYVLGREVLFQRATFLLTLREGPDIIAQGYPNLGLSSRRAELPPTLPFCNMNREHVPAGFGCYALTLLAGKTEGKFFIVSEEASKYKEANLRRSYAPEWCYPDEYDQRNKNSKLRTALIETIKQMGDDLPTGSEFRAEGDWPLVRASLRSFGRRLDNKIRWCDQTIQKLVRMRPEVSRQKHAGKRWEANYDLTIAQLYKINAILMQYRAQIDKLKDRPAPRLRAPDHVHRCRLFPARPKDKEAHFAGGRDERNALEKAKRAHEKVMRKHRNTPWAERARLELESLTPVKFEVTSLAPPEPSPIAPTPPEPTEPPPGV